MLVSNNSQIRFGAIYPFTALEEEFAPHCQLLTEKSINHRIYKELMPQLEDCDPHYLGFVATGTSQDNSDVEEFDRLSALNDKFEGSQTQSEGIEAFNQEFRQKLDDQFADDPNISVFRQFIEQVGKAKKEQPDSVLGQMVSLLGQIVEGNKGADLLKTLTQLKKQYDADLPVKHADWKAYIDKHIKRNFMMNHDLKTLTTYGNINRFDPKVGLESLKLD